MIPRPPAQVPNAPPDGSIAPDGYAPIPAWLGQTRAPRPVRSEAYRGRDGGQRPRRRLRVPLPARRPHHRERAAGPHPHRRQGRQAFGAACGPARDLEPGAAGIVRGPAGSRLRPEPRPLPHVHRAPRGHQPREPAAACRRADGGAGPALGRLDPPRGRENASSTPKASAAGRFRPATVRCSWRRAFPRASASIPWTGRSRSSSTASWGKSCASTPTDRFRRTTPSWAAPTPGPKSTRSASATIKAWRCTRAPAPLWVSEHGPRGGDEINVIEKGKNYGFPAIGYGHEYTGKPIHGDRTSAPGMEQPIYFWTPDIAPAGIAFYSGRLIPGWRDNLFVCALAGKHLVRLVLAGQPRRRRGAAAHRARRAAARRARGARRRALRDDRRQRGQDPAPHREALTGGP